MASKKKGSENYMLRFVSIYNENYMAKYGALSESLIEAFLKTPRHNFLPKEYVYQGSKVDDILKTGDFTFNGHRYTSFQTQPSFVLLMLHLLKLDEGEIHNILEIGSGCGWVCEMLAYFSRKIVGSEIFEDLCSFSRETLKSHNIDNVEIVKAEPEVFGNKGKGPYDRIIASCAIHIKELSKILVQLNPDGIAVIPITIKSLLDCSAFKKENVPYFEARAKEHEGACILTQYSLGYDKGGLFSRPKPKLFSKCTEGCAFVSGL